MGIPWKFGAPYFQDTCDDSDTAPVADSAHLLGFSDEILLHILSHVPSTDLVLNVRRTCRKLAALCLDKSLTHTVLLQKDYEVRGPEVAPGVGAEVGNNRGAPLRPGVPAVAAKSLQSCQTLCDPIDGSPPGSPVPGILQARTLEWVAISFSNA